MITDRIKEASMRLFNREITQKELRLMPYIQYVMVNNKKIDPDKIDDQERQMIYDWANAGYLEFDLSGEILNVSFDFYQKISEIIYLGYVDLTQEINLENSN